MAQHAVSVRMVVALLSIGLGAALSAAAQRAIDSSPRRDLVGRTVDARVVRIADGDTIEATLTGESQRVRIRLEGIDAPELGEPYGDEALKFLAALIGSGPVRVAGRDLDDYGRLVARVSVGAQDASASLVRAGLACHAYARDAALAREESQARAIGAGFWAGHAQKPRCVTRTAFSARGSDRRASPPGVGQPARPAGQSRGFRGNISSKLYHASWCPNFNCRNCTRLFANEAEATAAGFAPAADCLR